MVKTAGLTTLVCTCPECAKQIKIPVWAPPEQERCQDCINYATHCLFYNENPADARVRQELRGMFNCPQFKRKVI